MSYVNENNNHKKPDGRIAPVKKNFRIFMNENCAFQLYRYIASTYQNENRKLKHENHNKYDD